MLIPLCTSAKTRTIPVVVLLLVAVNLAIFLATRHDLTELTQRFGYFSGFTTDSMAAASDHHPVRLLTYTFLHGSWPHLIGNLWVFVVFGWPLENRLGSLQFLLLYIVLGAIAALVHGSWCATDPRPVIGASGAISGLLGCFIILDPCQRILSLVFLGLFSFVVEVPALVFVGIWFVLQVEAIYTLLVNSAAINNIAWWAHLGGFGGGLLLGSLKWLQARSINVSNDRPSPERRRR